MINMMKVSVDYGCLCANCTILGFSTEGEKTDDISTPSAGMFDFCDRKQILANSFMTQRSCLLFLFGLMNNTLWGATDLNLLRIPGVLQRFAVSYFVVGTLGLLLNPSRLTASEGSVTIAHWWLLLDFLFQVLVIF